MKKGHQCSMAPTDSSFVLAGRWYVDAAFAKMFMTEIWVRLVIIMMNTGHGWDGGEFESL